ncbi:MAG: protein kinase [Polyangiaceae bacterium]
MSVPPPRPSRRGAAAADDARLPIRPGDKVGEKYVVEGVIGAGGVGVVVSARHTSLDERVAIKFLQTSAMSSEENVSRFSREARALARIRSEHVARVMDFGALPSGAPYMVMEHLEGKDLGALLRSQGKVPVHEAVDHVAQACEAVVEAHAMGIIHRDLKPANLFLTARADGTPIIKVLDFGISKLLGRGEAAPDMSMTATASVIGSPLYMSPEQMESPRDAKEATDIWSLGTILYELIAGVPPFEAATLPALCARICTGSPTPIADRFPDAPNTVPRGLEQAIMACLERDVTKRPPSVAALVRRISQFGTVEALRCAERAERVAIQAGLPLGPASDEDTTLPDPEDVEEKTEVIGALSERSTTASQRLPEAVSFYPKPRRAQSRSRLIVAMVAVLFVGTLLGTLITQLKAPTPPPVTRLGRVYIREIALLALSSPAPVPPPTLPAMATETAPSPPVAVTSAAPSASVPASAAPVARPSRPSPRVPAPTPPVSANPPTDNVLLER